MPISNLQIDKIPKQTWIFPELKDLKFSATIRRGFKELIKHKILKNTKLLVKINMSISLSSRKILMDHYYISRCVQNTVAVSNNSLTQSHQDSYLSRR